MSQFENQTFWFAAGSQLLYGEDTLTQVDEDAKRIAAALNRANLPAKVAYAGVMKTQEEITSLMRRANYAQDCAGVITWMHTFSPSKMWIGGLRLLQKPLCHLHTQFNRHIPNEGIDMDYMNLHQSAHGDREHGFLTARLRMPRRVIVGYFEDADVQGKLSAWMRAAIGAAYSRTLRIMRFGDNMREVAVTEGDKIEAQIRLGWAVNTTPVGRLAEEIAAVGAREIDARLAEYRDAYAFHTDDVDAVRCQAAQEIAMERLLRQGGAGAFCTTFEDLYGLKQLPGLACQRLMAAGFGFGGEGDWKTAGLVAVMKKMAEGLPGGTSFMEDYTYGLALGNELVLGAHMLEVCPSIAAKRPRVEVHPLGIGGKEPPARLVFEAKEGPAILSSLVDMGGRLRLIVSDCAAIKPTQPMPNLPVARAMWRLIPDFKTAVEAWILCGGAHHTVMSYALSAEHMREWAEMMDIEYVHIGPETTIEGLKQQLFLNDLAWKLKQ